MTPQQIEDALYDIKKLVRSIPRSTERKWTLEDKEEIFSAAQSANAKINDLINGISMGGIKTAPPASLQHVMDQELGDK